MSDVSVVPCNDRTNRGVAHRSGICLHKDDNVSGNSRIWHMSGGHAQP
jgi:hypothetical protein